MKRLARALVPPLAAFALARAFLCLVAAGTSRPPWEAGSWSGPDSAHYLSIARRGYELVPCSPADPPPGHCGNAGWMPLYPWLLRPLIAVGAPPRWAAAVVPACLALATLAVLWAGSLSSWRRGGLIALAAAAAFPGQVYQHGAFPLALFSLLVLVCLGAAVHGRWWLAAAAGFGTALTYSTGWLLGPVLLAWGLLDRNRTPGRTCGAALAALATVGGFACVLLLHAWQLGAWDAFFLVQGAYGHRLANPLATWWLAVREVFAPPWQGVQEGPHLQTLLVGAWVAAVLTAARSRGKDGGATSLLALYTGALWLFPLLLGSGVSLYRSEATLLPSVLLARHLPRPLLLVVVAAMVLVAWPMAVLYFRLQLV